MSLLLRLYPGDGLAVVLLNALMQATAATGIALILGRFLLRRRPAARYAVAVVALVLVLLSPLLAVVTGSCGLSIFAIPLPSQESPAPGAVAQPVAAKEPVPHAGDSPFLPEPPAPGPEEMPGLAAETDTTSPRPQGGLSAATADTVRSAVAAGFIVWAGGAFWLMLRLLHGWRAQSRLKRGVRPLAQAGLEQMLRSVREILGIERLPPIVVSGGVPTPLSLGIFRPLVILPAGAVETLTKDQLRDVLVHECAHVLHRDHLLGLLERFARILFWFHPLVHLLNRQLSVSREEVCDNHVLSRSRPAEYAHMLVSLAEGVRKGLRMPSTAGLLPVRFKLEHRVIGLLDNRRDRLTRAKKSVLLPVVAVLVTASMLVAAKTATNSGDDTNTPAAARDAGEDRLATTEDRAGLSAGTGGDTPPSVTEAPASQNLRFKRTAAASAGGVTPTPAGAPQSSARGETRLVLAPSSGGPTDSFMREHRWDGQELDAVLAAMKSRGVREWPIKVGNAYVGKEPDSCRYGEGCKSGTELFLEDTYSHSLKRIVQVHTKYGDIRYVEVPQGLEIRPGDASQPGVVAAGPAVRVRPVAGGSLGNTIGPKTSSPPPRPGAVRPGGIGRSPVNPPRRRQPAGMWNPTGPRIGPMP